MSSADSIYYLTRKEIDEVLWNSCIDKADNGLIYAYTFYLDAMCTNWSALVLNDYKAVMPLPWRRKWGITYVYQPAFIQRLGVFGSISDEINSSFYKQASKHFPFIHYNVSAGVKLSNVVMRKRENFFISLNQEYEKIRSGYSAECITNLNKAIKRGCSFCNDVAPEKLIKNYQAAYARKNPDLKEADYERLHRLIREAQERNAADVSGIINEKGTVIYSAVIFRDSKRLYYILGAPTEEGRQKRATYFFIDYLLKSNSAKPLLFDFEGSEIPGVANFYKRFGPATELFFEIKISRLLFI
jgi:hypothetical protein